ncbi:MAG: peptidase dimerization domain-containing protein, partial [Clostridia bacterium]|nr:peptidase dimerization domain-containing protein [Clostridia bacterium]
GGEMNALLRTTIAFTQMEGSKAQNVIPAKARMVCNMRLNPSDTVDGALERLKKTVNDENVDINVILGVNPSRVSQTECDSYKKVEKAILNTWKGSVVAPYLMVQCSDSRHYGKISDKVYRFSACDLTSEERAGVHGIDEHLRLDAIIRSVEFYLRLLKQC